MRRLLALILGAALALGPAACGDDETDAGRERLLKAVDRVSTEQQTLHRRGSELLEVIAAAADAEPPPRVAAGPQRDPVDQPVVSLAQALLRHRAREAGIATELIATQSELTALVAAVRAGETGDGIRALGGWRRELVGQELCDLVNGRLALSVSPEGTLFVQPTE